jgi:hypothetical protein
LVSVASAHKWLFNNHLFFTGSKPWRVHSTYERAVNFQVGSHFISVTTAVDGPATIVIDDRLPDLSPGTYVTPSKLLDLSSAASAKKWFPPRHAIYPGHLNRRVLDDLRMAIESSGKSALLQQAFTPWLTHTLSAITRNFPKIPAEISQLIGLGPGMTPSGDDFLAGFCHVLSHTTYMTNCSNLALYTVKTSILSRHMIWWACRGVVASPFEDLLYELLDPSGDFCRRVTAALAIGHFSGADHLLGAWFALSLLYKKYEIDQ